MLQTLLKLKYYSKVEGNMILQFVRHSVKFYNKSNGSAKIEENQKIIYRRIQKKMLLNYQIEQIKKVKKYQKI